MNLKDKIVVITGGSKGLGKVLASFLKKEGSNVIICAKNTKEVETTANELSVDFFVGDVTKEKDMQELADSAEQKFGKIDIWVNNAGLLYSFSPKDKYIDIEKAREMMDVNLFGTIFGSRSALGKMQSNKDGTIINIISTAALDASKAKNLKIYFASKWASRGYTQAIEAQYKEQGISVIAVYPGGIQTELWRNHKPENIDQFMKPEYVAEKIISNLKQETPEKELIIKRPIV
ncbi:SDR family oxidoreductase [Candidatus Nomurabacteria bacterium]|nr:SDR family oxidoreductase [Candidatus Nomurabacteria bacterium]